MLTDEQKTAITYSGQKHCILAATAGSGKSAVMLERCRFLVDELGVDPSTIVMITFTNTAVNRLSQQTTIECKFIETFHSFARQWLQSEDVVKSGWKEKRTEISHPDTALLNLIDFLGDEQNSKRARRGVTHLLVDEVQDNSMLFHQIIERLSSTTTLFLCGDPAQSIMSFMGADLSLFHRLAERDDVHRMNLSINFRCSSPIVDLANAVMQGCAFYTRAVAASTINSEKPLLRQHRSTAAALASIVDEIKSPLAAGRGRVCIIARTTRTLRLARMHLLREGIPFKKNNGKRAADDAHPDVIHLSTIHSSKALQWDWVYLLDLEHDVFPDARSDLDEERRLFYVAITRAQHRLSLHNCYDRPSPFLIELSSIQPLHTWFQCNIGHFAPVVQKNLPPHPPSSDAYSKTMLIKHISNWVKKLTVHDYASIYNQLLPAMTLEPLSVESFRHSDSVIAHDLEEEMSGFLDCWFQRYVQQLAGSEHYKYPAGRTALQEGKKHWGYELSKPEQRKLKHHWDVYTRPVYEWRKNLLSIYWVSALSLFRTGNMGVLYMPMQQDTLDEYAQLLEEASKKLTHLLGHCEGCTTSFETPLLHPYVIVDTTLVVFSTQSSEFGFPQDVVVYALAIAAVLPDHITEVVVYPCMTRRTCTITFSKDTVLSLLTQIKS